MSDITPYMTSDHRECDAHFAQAESAVAAGRWEDADRAWTTFAGRLTRHFQLEEEILFPAFEEATGITHGPTQVMRREHTQMRALVGGIEAARTARDTQGVLGHLETLLILMQQHNLKEEQILYPMSDNHLPDSAAVATRLRTQPA